MKPNARGVAGGIAVLALAGCAGMSQPSQVAEIDYAYVGAVQNAAKRYGTEVIWVTYPTKRVAADAAQK